MMKYRYLLSHNAGNTTFEVTLFEARDRLGGRAYTSYDCDIPVDMGSRYSLFSSLFFPSPFTSFPLFYFFSPLFSRPVIGWVVEYTSHDWDACRFGATFILFLFFPFFSSLSGCQSCDYDATVEFGFLHFLSLLALLLQLHFCLLFLLSSSILSLHPFQCLNPGIHRMLRPLIWYASFLLSSPLLSLLHISSLLFSFLFFSPYYLP